MLAADLRRSVRGDVLDAAAAVALYAHDFGGMLSRAPKVVVRPAREEDVVATLRIAADHGVAVSTRGAGHSQCGQGLGDQVVVDMTGLGRVLAVRADDGIVEAEAGASWRSIVDATFRERRLPRGLTHALDPTIGGTLSIAGVGAESFRVGPQVDNVASIDVATAAGDIVRCSHGENRSLFDAVRAGVGQCGVILRVRYPLRPCKSLVTTRTFVYRDVERFLQDAVCLAKGDAPVSWLACSLVREPATRSAVALLLVGQDSDVGEADLALPAMHADYAPRARLVPIWTGSGVPGHGFFHVFGTGATSDGAPPALNPWVERVFDLETGADALKRLVVLSDAVLDYARVGVIFLRRGTEPAPLFVVPAGDLLIGVGVFATFRDGDRLRAEAATSDLHEELRRFGGKRYLSGYAARASAVDWAEHFGAAWDGLRSSKVAYDPDHRLNPGFIQWK
jgi:FAD/FMN-containing dehydrogenase